MATSKCLPFPPHHLLSSLAPFSIHSEKCNQGSDTGKNSEVEASLHLELYRRMENPDDVWVFLLAFHKNNCMPLWKKAHLYQGGVKDAKQNDS